MREIDVGCRNQEHQPRGKEIQGSQLGTRRAREKPVQNGIKSPESLGKGNSVSHEAQLERNGKMLKINSARGENEAN